MSTLAQRFGAWVPGFVLRRLMGVETAIEAAVSELAQSTADGSRVLDAGSGEGRHRAAFTGRRYVGVDLAVGDAAWDYSELDVTGDLSQLPFKDESFDAALNVVVLEHTRDPPICAGLLLKFGFTCLAHLTGLAFLPIVRASHARLKFVARPW